ncbi:radical SAM protein [Candidatus Poribacteria bacterium]|nr:radical SAM protein [Candidatus Poribacteria bacterium]
MAYEIDLLRKLLHFNSPAYLVYHVTYKCNSKCSFCFNWQSLNNTDKNELTLFDVEKLAKNLPYLMQLTLSGGEPTLRDDLPEICHIFYKWSKINLITLPTNGLNPDRISNIANKILKLAPKTHLRMVLTINGDESLHDRLSGIPGAFKQVLETYKQLENLRSKNSFMTIDLITVLNKENQSVIPETSNFIKKYLSVNTHLITLVRGNIKNPEIKEFDPDIYYNMAKKYSHTYKRNKNKPFAKILDVINQMNMETIYHTFKLRSAQLPCVAGKKLIMVSPEGVMRPCEYLDKSFGNLKDANFSVNELLNNSEGHKIQKYIRKSRCFCTWECSTQANIIYNPLVWPIILLRYIIDKAI